MAHVTMTLRFDRPIDDSSGKTKRNKEELLRKVYAKVLAAIGGTERNCSFDISQSSTDPVYAVSVGAISGGSGSVGLVLNGISLTATAAGGDTNSAGLVAGVINASSNALVQYNVIATNLVQTLTLTSTPAGAIVRVCDRPFVAVNGTAPQQMASNQFAQFDMSGSDTQDATSLALAINKHPGLQRYVSAFSAAAVVYIFPRSAAWFTGPNAPPNKILSASSAIVASASTFAASANIGISASKRGKSGNWITCTATGTGVSMVGSTTALTLGLGDDAAWTNSLLGNN